MVEVVRSGMEADGAMKTARMTYLLAILILIILTATASAILLTEQLNDVEYAAVLGLLSDNAFTTEGRIGDLTDMAAFEIDIGQEFSNPTQADQFGWPNGAAVSFALTYDHLMNVASFCIGGQTLQYSPLSPFTDVFVRTQVVKSNSTVFINDMVINGEAAAANSSEGGPDGVQTLWIKCGWLGGGFTLSGTVVMSWSGETSRNSRLAFQIKTGAMETVPAEETAWGRVKKSFE